MKSALITALRTHRPPDLLESSFFLSGAVSGKIPPSVDLSVARNPSVCRSVNGSQEDYLVDGT